MFICHFQQAFPNVTPTRSDTTVYYQIMYNSPATEHNEYCTSVSAYTP